MVFGAEKKTWVVAFLEYIRYRVEIVNRGGLIYVTDDFYKFIRKIEYAVRQVLKICLIWVI